MEVVIPTSFYILAVLVVVLGLGYFIDKRADRQERDGGS